VTYRALPCESVASVLVADSRGISRESVELVIWTRAGEDLGITDGNHPATLALKRAGHDCGAAAFLSPADNLIDELD
jgi:hypothetical protein